MKNHPSIIKSKHLSTNLSKSKHLSTSELVVFSVITTQKKRIVWNQDMTAWQIHAKRLWHQDLSFFHVTYILFSSSAFLPSFVTLGVGHFSSETGHVIIAIFRIPLHPALLASKAKLLVLVFPLTRGAVKRKRNIFLTLFNDWHYWNCFIYL